MSRPAMNRSLTAILLLVGAAVATGCSRLTPEEELRLVTFKQNSKLLYDDEQFRQAEDQCRKGLVLDPDDLSLNQALAYSLLRQRDPGRLHEAEGVFRNCIRLDDEDLRSQLGLAEVLYQLGALYEGVIAGFDADERLTPDQRARKVEAAATKRDASFEECEELLNDVLDTPIGRENDWAHNTLARLYANQGRYDDAADILRKLVARLQNSLKFRQEQVDPESLSPEYRDRFEGELDRLERSASEALHFVATIAAKRGRHDEVVAAYAQIENMTELDPADYFNRAVAYDELGAREAAIHDFETFTTLAASRGVAFSENVHRAMRRTAELRAGKPTRREAAQAKPAAAAPDGPANP